MVVEVLNAIAANIITTIIVITNAINDTPFLFLKKWVVCVCVCVYSLNGFKHFVHCLSPLLFSFSTYILSHHPTFSSII